MHDIKKLIDDDLRDGVKAWVHTHKHDLNSNIISYTFQEASGDVTCLCTPLFYAVMVGKGYLAKMMLAEGADPFKCERVCAKPEAICAISKEPLIGLEQHEMTRISNNRDEVKLDRVFISEGILEWLSREKIHPFTREALEPIEAKNQPLNFDALTMAVRLGYIDIIQEMKGTRHFYRDVLKYALLYNRSEIVYWVLEQAEGDMRVASEISVDLIAFWVKKQEVLQLGEAAAVLYWPAVNENNIVAIEWFLEKKIHTTDDIKEAIIGSIDEESPEDKLKYLLDHESLGHNLVAVLLARREIDFDPKHEFFRRALKRRKTKCVRLMIEAGADPNQLNRRYHLVQLATHFKDFDSLRMLIEEYDADVNAVAFNGFTALMLSVDNHMDEIRDYLLSRRATEVRNGKEYGYEPLVHALANNEEGARLDSAAVLLGHYALEKVYKFTLPKGEDEEEYTEMECHIIHLLIYYRTFELIQRLVDADKACIEYTFNGLNAWMYALSLGYEDEARYLMTHYDLKKDVEFARPGEAMVVCPPIYIAAYYGCEEIVEWLVNEKGVNVNQVFSDYTVLGHLLRDPRFKNDSMIKTLLELGANVRPEYVNVTVWERFSATSWLKKLYDHGKKAKIKMVRRGDCVDAIVTPPVTADEIEGALQQGLFLVPFRDNDQDATRVLNVGSKDVRATIKSMCQRK